MGLRWQKRITIFPGIRVNLSRSGVSWTFGPRGMSVTVGKRGTYGNVGLPGTGLSYRKRFYVVKDTESPILQHVSMRLVIWFAVLITVVVVLWR